MKDLYSAHVSESDMLSYYEKVKVAYQKIFKRLGFNFRVIETGGGVFTDRNTHEFQVLAEGGEDTIFYCDSCSWGQNKEIFEGEEGQKCPSCKKGQIIKSKSIEVGNIFPLGTWYAERMRVYYQDKKGMKKPVWFASYGIGPTRTMGAWVEVSHDEKGIIWNKVMSPFDVHLVELPGAKGTKNLYKKLNDAGIDVLWDDRNLPAGEKFADADLIGIPVRLVVSEKTKDEIEFKRRSEEKGELLSFDEVVKRL
jgi:prolyl-tRNA synthetase